MGQRTLAALIALAFVLALSTVGCTGNAGGVAVTGTKQAQGEPSSAASARDVPGVTENEVLVGTWMPLTGPAAAWGVVGRTYEAYARFLNEKGGIHGRKLRVIVEDDGYSPAKTVPLVKKMVEQDRVFLIMGGLGTPSGTAVMDYLIQNGVPHLAPSSGSSKWSEPVKPGYYGWQISYRTEARILVRYAVETLKKRKYAVFYQNDDYGREGLEEARAQLAKRGGELVAEVAYSVTDADYSAYALKLKESGAEAVLSWPGVKQYAALLKEAWKIGYRPAWLASASVADSALIKLAPDESQGGYFLAYLPDPNDPANAAIPAVAEWRANLPKYGKDLPLNSSTLLGWGHGRLLEEILTRAGRDLTRERFEQAAQSLKDWHDLASVTYSAEDRRGITSGWIAQARGENLVKITEPMAGD